MHKRPTFGEWLKARRKALDVTQAELAKQVGYAEVSLRKVETGVQRPSKQMASRLAEALKIAPDEQLAFMHFARGEATEFSADEKSVPHPRWHHARRAPNLPIQPTPLIGRGQEVAAVRKWLLHDNHRLVTLLGPPGVGKTRLAIEVAGEVADEFEDGVYFVSLAAVTDAAIVPLEVCHSMGLQESGLTPTNRLKLYLAEKHLLLVIDNFEHLLSAALIMAELLETCPWLQILATSRAPLRVQAERQLPVPPLALPDLAHLPEQGELAHYAAIALFLECAQRAQPDLALTPDNAATVAAICTTLDGLPLAIELIAARVKVLEPQALLERLRGRLLSSGSGLRDVTPRHQTLRQAIDWSYTLLTPEEQGLLMRLGIFAGGCTLEAVEAICGADNGFSLDVVDGLASLVDKSLIYRKVGPDSSQRFMLLETIREYALERLEASGDSLAVRRSHAETFLQLAENAVPHLRRTEQVVWLQRLEADHDNLRAALAWCVGDEGEPLLGMRLVKALSWFWFVHNYYSEGSRWVDAVLLAAGEDAPRPLRAWMLYVGSLLAVGLDDFQRGHTMGEEALALARKQGDQQLLLQLVMPYCIHCGCQGRFQQAEMLLQEAQSVADLLDDSWANAEIRLSRLCWRIGPAPMSLLSEETLALARERGDRRLLACSLGYCMDLAIEDGRWTQAEAWQDEMLSHAHQLGDKRVLISVYETQGGLAYLKGDYVQAAACYDEMLELARQMGTLGYVAGAFMHLGRVAQKQGETSEALLCYRRGLTLVKGLEHSYLVALCVSSMATLAMEPNPLLDMIQATRLLGATDGIYSLDRLTFGMDAVTDCEFAVATVRARLSEPVYATAWAEGKAMSTDEAIAYALSCGELREAEQTSAMG
jgi:predicted ATPase/transcriptional regulator with XRE-family HTH domain